MNSGRTFLAAVATVVASVAILATLLAHSAHVLVDSSSFSSEAVRVVQTVTVESFIVDSVTNRVVAEVGDQPAVRPLVNAGVHEALSHPQITDEIRRAAATLETELASGHASALTLTLPDAGSPIAATIRPRSPELADAVSRVGTITVLDVHIPSSAGSAIHDLAIVGRDSSLLIVFSAAMAALALILSCERRRTMSWLGLGALVSGLIAAGIYIIGRTVLVNQFSGSAARTAAHAVWSVYLGGLEGSGLVIAAIGAVVAALAILSRRRRRRSGRAEFARA